MPDKRKSDKRKIAIVLFNLGGPDKPENVSKFLFNLFYDKAIIRLPNPFRYILAKFISFTRNPKAKEIYKQLGGGSPILPETKLQAKSLEQKINKENKKAQYKVFIAMRYFHPFVAEAFVEIKNYDPDEIILLPLYPHYSTTTTASSIDSWQDLCIENDCDIPTRIINDYYDHPLFIAAHTDLLKPIYKQALKKGQAKILFSAHSLPQSIVDKGDPYQKQIEESCNSIVAMLNMKNIDWEICYQSKVGRMKWLEPNAIDVITQTVKANKIPVIVPISFVSEHSETLVELDIEYKELAIDNGAKDYFRVPALRDNEIFINCLIDLCKE